jgi:glutathione S-transferase
VASIRENGGIHLASHLAKVDGFISVSALHALAVMEERLCSSAWLAAGQYAIADIALYAFTHTAKDGGFELAPYSRVRAQPGHIPQMREEQGVPVVNWPR